MCNIEDAMYEGYGHIRAAAAAQRQRDWDALPEEEKVRRRAAQLSRQRYDEETHAANAKIVAERERLMRERWQERERQVRPGELVKAVD